MAEITVKIRGSQVIISKFEKVQLAINTITGPEARSEMEKAVDALVHPYPDELTNQRYIRTGKRGRATKLVFASGNNQYSKKYTLESNPRYKYGRTGNPYVVGDAEGGGQARIHQGRWRLIKRVVEDAVGRIMETARRRLHEILMRGPGGL